MDDMDTAPLLRITWEPAGDAIVQGAEMITFYAAHPHVRHDSSDLDDFTL